jgi:hypothetical protein
MFAQDCSEEELRAVGKELLTPQRDRGIDVHGARVLWFRPRVPKKRA